MIAGDSLGARVEHPLSIHNEEIMMMPMAERHLDTPGPIGLANHWVRAVIPIIEITHNRDTPGSMRVANEHDRFDDSFGGITTGFGSEIK